jgi:hypothetical protein
MLQGPRDPSLGADGTPLGELAAALHARVVDEPDRLEAEAEARFQAENADRLRELRGYFALFAARRTRGAGTGGREAAESAESAESAKSADAAEAAEAHGPAGGVDVSGWETVNVCETAPGAWTALCMAVAGDCPARALELMSLCLDRMPWLRIAKPVLDTACRAAAAAGDIGTARLALSVLEAAARDTGCGDLPQEARRAVAAFAKKARKGAGAAAPGAGKGSPGKGGPGKGGPAKGGRGGGRRR